MLSLLLPAWLQLFCSLTAPASLCCLIFQFRFLLLCKKIFAPTWEQLFSSLFSNSWLCIVQEETSHREKPTVSELRGRNSFASSVGAPCGVEVCGFGFYPLWMTPPWGGGFNAEGLNLGAHKTEAILFIFDTTQSPSLRHRIILRNTCEIDSPRRFHLYKVQFSNWLSWQSGA